MIDRRRGSSFLLLGLTLFASTGAVSELVGQGNQTSVVSESLRNGLRGLDSPSPSDWQKAEAMLNLSMKNPDERARATCGLAILHIRRGNTIAIESLNRKIAAMFPQPQDELKVTLLRVQLWRDIAQEQSTQATEHFSQLRDLTLNGALSKPSRLASCALLGSVVGMLEPELAQSLIDRSQLMDTKAALAQSRNAEIANVFAIGYDRALAHSSELVQWLQDKKELEAEEVTKLAKIDLDVLQAAIRDNEQATTDNRLKQKELELQKQQRKNGHRALQQQINQVKATWNQHPEVHNPRVPNKDAIKVPTTERVRDGYEEVKKTRYYTDSKGQRQSETYYKSEPKYKTVKRSKHEIERDIDAIYTRLMREYTALKAMQQELLNNKAMLDAQLAQLDAGMRELDSEIDSANKNGRSLLVELKSVELKSRVINEGLTALNSGKPSAAFRPPSFEIVDYVAERKALSN
jgi:hypothetical protein